MLIHQNPWEKGSFGTALPNEIRTVAIAWYGFSIPGDGIIALDLSTNEVKFKYI